MSRYLLIVAIALLLAGAGFAGGWFARSPGKQCGVLPAYTDVGPDPNDPYFGTTTTVHGPELVCK